MEKYLYYGDEEYLLMQELSKLKNSFLGGQDGLSIEEFKEKSSVESLIDAAFSVSLFSSKKLIIFNGIPDVRDDYYEHFKRLFEDNTSDNSVCFVIRKMPDKRKKIVKYLMDTCQTKEFKKFDVWQRDKVIAISKSIVSEQGFEIEDIAINELVDMVGYDLWMLSSNIEKIGTSILPRKKIVLNDVKLYACNEEQSVFEFIDAFRKKNKKSVFKYLKDIRKQEEAYPLLSMLTSHLRLLLLMKSCNTTNVSELVKKAGKSPFYIKKLVSDLNLWELQDLRKVLSDCHELDYLGKSGKLNPLVGLERLGLEVFH